MRQRVLFICSANVLRSPTAEEIFSADPSLEVTSAGTNDDAECPVSAETIEWADTIVVMEGHHRRNLESRFATALEGKQLVVLGIPDIYERMAPKLVDRLHATAHLWKRVPIEEKP